MAANIEVVPFEREMLPEVAALMVRQYGGDPATRRRRLERLLEPPGPNPVIAFSALSDGRVVGFQSYQPWPMSVGPDRRTVYQSGNSIVDESTRGAGVFGSLLRAGAAELAEHILIGFPVPASFPAFVSNGWTRPLSLQWWVRPLIKRRGDARPPDEVEPWDLPVADRVSFAGSEQFSAWRSDVRAADDQVRTVALRGVEGYAQTSLQRRSLKGVSLREFVIGNIRLAAPDADRMASAIAELTTAGTVAGAHFLSMAVNDLSREWQTALQANGFRASRRSISFIIKNYTSPPVMPWHKWWIFRGDIDTW